MTSPRTAWSTKERATPGDVLRQARCWRGRASIAACTMLVAAAAWGDPLDTTIANALRDGALFPDVPAAIDEASAYTIQARVVEAAYGAAIGGYKAGLTSAAAQKQFGVEQPVLGVLPKNGRLAPLATIARVPGLKIEVEIGFVVGADSRPSEMLAAIELPRLVYADMKQVTLADIVATNVAAYRFIAGPGSPVDPNVRDYAVSLERDGEVLFSATAADALGDPLNAYTWMVERIRALHYRLEPGLVLITGSLGRVVDAEPGEYVARYGPLGTLKFTITGEASEIQTAR